MTAVADLFRLDGAVAVVTGGAGLYGRHIVTALAEAGARVAVASRNLDAVQAFARQMSGQGLSVTAHRLDIADEESVVAFRREIVAASGRIDVLVNNAVARAGSDPSRTSASQWDATSRVNSRGLFLMTRECGAQMIEQGAGVMINIGSIYGMVGPEFAIYGATGMTVPAFYAYDKGGMVNFTRYAACFYAPHGIRVNCISPGGLADGTQPAEFVRNYESRVPLGRLAGEQDIKGAVVFLASPAAGYVTGVNLPVDGGWTAR
jgi:NAD(P)-dependent dehydrogenase (short-subunit alcohol dehydrogenase family)